MSTSTYKPADIPDQSGRVFLITGGTTGLGAGSISLIAAKNPAHIFFSGRNVTRANELIAKVKTIAPATKVTFIECDLTSLASVKEAARTFLSQSNRLDVLMCNAGIMAFPASTSKDGYEIQFATNHLGHALLQKLLLPTILATAEQGADVRVVYLTSTAHTAAPKNGIEFDTIKSPQASLGPIIMPSKWVRYGQSKLANLLYAQELARRYPSILSVAVHPGFIRTELHEQENFVDRQLVNIISGGKWISVEEGPYNQIWAATAKKEDVKTGAYYEPVAVDTPVLHKTAKDSKVAGELWAWTEKELKEYEL